jgi:hypothetical protein
MATNRKLAESTVEAKDYFLYAAYEQWTPRYMRTAKMAEFLCPECSYVPRRDSTQPRRAFKVHVQKNHALLFMEKYNKPYIIQEEPDFTSPYADVALAYA